MLVGYNNNITYKGKVYHVQTEDSGLKNPIIVTLLYYKGSILSSKKTDYSHLIGNPDIKGTVRELMKQQHKAMLKELIAGKHTAGIEAEAEPERKEEKKIAVEPAVAAVAVPQPIKKQAEKTLDDILLDYIIKRDKGR